jgi:cytochrome oxidase Cu insertion factor (SCO1/SenC/PrrC family)
MTSTKIMSRNAALVAVAIIGALATANAVASPISHPAEAANALTDGDTAPPIDATDVSGKRFVLSAYKGHLVALFFYCGCEPCHEVASAWSSLGRAGVLSTPPFSRADPPVTVVVFSGDARAARAFATSVRTSPNTILVPDPTLALTERYAVDPCPRVFILDAQGRIAYTNNHPGDAPRIAPASAIVARVLSALRRCR